MTNSSRKGRSRAARAVGRPSAIAAAWTTGAWCCCALAALWLSNTAAAAASPQDTILLLDYAGPLSEPFASPLDAPDMIPVAATIQVQGTAPDNAAVDRPLDRPPDELLPLPDGYDQLPVLEPLNPPLTQPERLPPPTDEIRPPVLRPPVLRSPDDETPLLQPDPIAPPTMPGMEWDAPLGFTGPSSIVPREGPTDPHFIPIEDRWRIGLPPWDRYGRQPTLDTEFPYALGALLDPYHQNVLKGDYPIAGQHTFFNFTATSLNVFEYRQLPTPTTPFESTFDPAQNEFFGDPNQFFSTNYVLLSFDLFHGDTAAFKPVDWRIKLTPAANLNHLAVQELAIVNPDVQQGRTRTRGDFSLEEWFIETKLADTSPHYDFVSLRAGSQPFTSDFRGFVFSDINRAVRLFGTRHANRHQFNLVWFDQTEKDTNSQLNTFDDRHQNTVIANYYVQDFLWPGYTAQWSFHYNRDRASFKFDDNDFLARPEPVGVFHPHEINACYLGWAGDGHIERINLSHAYYFVFGRDSLNPMAGRRQEIQAHMAAVELSYDRDWVRFRTSFFFASGDDDPYDGQARGFDSIFDNPAFAGGAFSFWQRQQIGLLGTSLVNRFSLVPDLRTSKFQGQSNFVNPGLLLANLGMDVELTPKCRLIANANYLWFAETGVLERFVFQDQIDREIGADLSLGMEYRPLLNNQVILLGGVSTLIPGGGFKNLYGDSRGEVDAMAAAFVEGVFSY